MDFQQTVGKNVKQIREERKLTLDVAAKLTGVSRSMLAQIEKGDVNPTISVLWKIANGYKTSFTSLLSTHDSSYLLIRSDQVEPLEEDSGRYRNRPAFPFQPDTRFETYLIEIQPGGSLQAQPHMAGTEEFLSVFSGQVEITAGSQSFQLGQGDSLRFRADTPHAYKNGGEQAAALHMIIFYPDQPEGTLR
jgi:transcriptional regulator with XRE-family HTH domain